MSFAKFVERHGPAFDRQAVPDATLADYAGRVPDPLLAHWSECGWAGYANGFLWTTDPRTLAEPLVDWLGDRGRGCTVFGRSGFGHMFFWDGQKSAYLDVFTGEVTTLFSRIDFFLEMLTDKRTLNDIFWMKLFARATKRLGRLERDECYGFLPPLAMGGTFSAEALRRCKLREHLAILVEVTPR